MRGGKVDTTAAGKVSKNNAMLKLHSSTFSPGTGLGQWRKEQIFKGDCEERYWVRCFRHLSLRLSKQESQPPYNSQELEAEGDEGAAHNGGHQWQILMPKPRLPGAHPSGLVDAPGNAAKRSSTLRTELEFSG